MNDSSVDNSSHRIPASDSSSRPSEKGDLEAADSQVCWIELKQSSYQPNHQDELLHLQAEADTLLLKLQAINQERLEFVDEPQN